MECKSLRDSDQEIRGFNVNYFMISTDTLADNRAFAEKNAASFPILSDVAKSVTAAFGALSESGYAKRWTFYIDPQGKIARIDRDVAPQTAGVQLVQNLEQLAVPRLTR